MVEALRGQSDGFRWPKWAGHRRRPGAERNGVTRAAASPQEVSMFGKGLGLKDPGVQSQAGSSREGGITWDYPQGRNPGNDPAAWVTKPLGSSPGPPEAWMI
jgi:hypothetical protein